jgi:hypothetical protein
LTSMYFMEGDKQ